MQKHTPLFGNGHAHHYIWLVLTQSLKHKDCYVTLLVCDGKPEIIDGFYSACEPEIS